MVNLSTNMIKYMSYIRRCIWGVETSIEIFLALGHRQTELANIGWPIGILTV